MFFFHLKIIALILSKFNLSTLRYVFNSSTSSLCSRLRNRRSSRFIDGVSASLSFPKPEPWERSSVNEDCKLMFHSQLDYIWTFLQYYFDPFFLFFCFRKSIKKIYFRCYFSLFHYYFCSSCNVKCNILSPFCVTNMQIGHKR